jgi:hypothetical protein
MRLFSIVILILFGVNLALGQDFRDYKWGETKEKIKASEELKLLEESDEMLVYSGSIASKACFIGFILDDDILTRGAYFLNETYVNENKYVDDFYYIKELLTKKYGEPELEGENWSNELFKNDKKDWGIALKSGHVTFVANWMTEKTQIELIVSAENRKVSSIILYKDLSRKDEMKEESEKRKMDGL